MIVTHYGHAMFQIELLNGTRVLFDPFGEEAGYPMPALQPDYICTSHDHFDHNNVQNFPYNQDHKQSIVFNKAGHYYIDEHLEITMFLTYHDDKQGSLRGENLITSVKGDGLHFVHLGDLGEELSLEIQSKLGSIDLLCVPVGGFYTINAKQASALCKELSPKIIIPMHYKTAFTHQWTIESVNAFLEYEKTMPEELSILRVTKEDLSEQPNMVVMKIFSQE